MKYRLKKDLPFAKAGAEITFTELNVIVETDKRTNYYFGRDELNDLINEGWIEEVKPREWWVLFNSDGSFRAYFTNPEHCYKQDRDKLIKVREVIE